MELTQSNFNRVMADHSMVLVFFYSAASEGGHTAAPTRQEFEPASDPWLWAELDVDSAPEIAGMFGVTADLPALLIMRDQIALYCEPLSATNHNRTMEIIDGAARLDMARVRQEIEQEKAARATLFARRVCPTALRTPHPESRD